MKDKNLKYIAISIIWLSVSAVVIFVFNKTGDFKSLWLMVIALLGTEIID